MDIHLLSSEIDRKRNARTLLEYSLCRLGPAKAGSLLVRYAYKGRISTRKNKHGLKGPYYFVSCKGKHSYVRSGKLSHVRRLLDNYKRFRKGLKDITRYNREITKLLKLVLWERIREGKQ